ncbi:MAG TPA: hypothetical protein PLR41_02010 [Alphaproteobacteria bacterium]|nr:hypothetical protein [Alphaproteobacteria bacterium]
MKLKQIDDVIIVRHLALRNSDVGVVVKIGRPAKFPDDGGYYCPYQFLGLGDERVRYAGGADELQSVILALKKIGIELYTSAEYRCGRLYWLEQDNKDLGFPLPDGVTLEDLISRSE